MKEAKPRTPFLSCVAQFFGVCFLLFGTLVMGFGMPKQSFGFLIPGALLMLSSMKFFRSWVATLMPNLIRKLSPTGGKNVRN